MADEGWNSNSSMSLCIMHEVNDQGIYQMTVSDKASGELFFAWKLPAEEALAVGNMMSDVIGDWLLGRVNDRGNQDQAAPSEPGEIWPDTP